MINNKDGNNKQYQGIAMEINTNRGILTFIDIFMVRL